jgi:hypothetical protein
VNFQKNKYFEWYYNIISKAQNSGRAKGGAEYYESHHIIPKSLGGSNAPKNLVLLTAREHFICHLLLVKITTGLSKNKMMYAVSFFTTRNINSRQYAIACLYNSVSKRGKNNPAYGKVPWNKGKSGYLTEEAKQRIAIGAQQWRDSGGMNEVYREKISKSLKGRKKPAGFGDKLSAAVKGEKHWSYNGRYHTPHGDYPNSTAIEDIVPNQLVRKWCKSPDKAITKSQYAQVKYLQTYGRSVIGKTFREIGFFFVDNVTDVD